jgi:phosphomannomutase/phosphoglucomutase
MTATPRNDLRPNTLEFENEPLVAATGFREYDARWLYPEEINLLGMQALGLGLGTYLHELGVEPKIVVGHDFRSYSIAIKQGLTLGLMRAGCAVYDIGLALSPVAYFAQFALDVPAVAMVTASHNENGWTGVKMGAERPLTFGPDEIARLKEIVLGGHGVERSGGKYVPVKGMRERYIDDVTRNHKLSRPIRVIAACGNGTAGAFAPEALSRIGADVIPMDAELDFTFPKYNPNPEDMKMLHAMSAAVKEHGTEVALGFDGDGDRCGVVDDKGEEIFADKVGVLLARDLSTRVRQGLLAGVPSAGTAISFSSSSKSLDTSPAPLTFVVDVKSTGAFEVDPVLKANNVTTDYWKTGHSYIKRRTAQLGALAGFEKSGHYFFNPPVGRGYDDSLVAAIAILEMLDRAGNKRMSALVAELPATWGSPTMAPYCPDTDKYRVADELTKEFEGIKARGEKILGQNIVDLVTVNGVRVVLEDGTWGLVRASSNKPSLVVVCESPVSEAQMRAMFAEMDARISRHPEVGEYDQKI